MWTRLSCIIVDADPANRQEMAGFLGERNVEVVAQCGTLDELAARLGGAEAPQIALVNLDPAPQQNLKRLAPMVRQWPGVSFFALSEVVDPTLLMDAIQMGVRQFVPLPIDEERFAAGLERVAQLQGGSHRARLIHVIPSCGGCGATTVSCNVAAALARSGRTVLVDLDLMYGTVATAFDVRPRYTIADVIEGGAEKIDRQLLDNALALHEPTGVSLLPRPLQPEDVRRVNPGGFSRLLGVLSQSFDYVVLDSLMSMDPLYSGAIQQADFNVIVMQLSVPSARNTERFVASLGRMGIGHDKIRVVVNRFVKRGSEIEPDQVERTLGLKIAWTIPNDFRSTMTAINYGQPVLVRSPRAEVSHSLDGLAKALNGRSA